MAADLKISNRKTVYRLIRQQGELSKAEISRITGISPPTILKIIDYFSSFGLVAETGSGVSAVGRRPQLLRAVPDAAYTLGVLFDGRRLSLGLVDLAGTVKTVRRSQSIPDLKNLLEVDLPREALSLIGELNIRTEHIKGIGIGVPGVVDRSREIVRFAPLAGVHEDFHCAPLLRKLESRLGCPAFLENDANVAALGEHAARGGGRGVDLILVELGRGLGAGIVLDGNLRRGPRCMAGEIGYLVLDPAWKASSDAPGWLERRMDLDEFWNEVEADRRPSAAALKRVVSYLALGLSNIVLALDLDLIVIGRTGLEHFGSDFLDLLKKELSRLSVLPTLCEASVLEDPGVSGAAGMVAESWLENIFAG